MKSLLLKYKQPLVYLLYGGLTTLVNILTYYLCDKIGLDTAVSTSVAWLLSVLFAYGTNRAFVFQSRAKGKYIIKELFSFLFCRLATGLTDLALMLLYVDLVGYNGLVIKILSNGLVIALNYLCSKAVIFRDRPQIRKPLRERAADFVLRAAVLGFCAYIGLSLLLNVTVNRRINGYYPPNLLSGHISVMMLLALLLFGLLALPVFLAKRSPAEGKNARAFYLYTAVYFLACLALQLFIIKKICFRTGWDAGVVYENARHLLEGSDTLRDSGYFSRYPNNFLLLYTVKYLLAAGGRLYRQNPDSVLVCVNALAVNLSVMLAVFCVYKTTGRKSVAAVSAFLGTGLILLSPWILIPYTDTLGMPFPVLAVTCYLFFRNRHLKVSLTTVFFVMGYFYKPTVLIGFIALVMLEPILTLGRTKQLSVKKSFLPFVSMLLSFAAVFCLLGSLVDGKEFAPEEEAAFSVTHYLKMGMNERTDGVYAVEDEETSAGCSTRQEREAENIECFKQRLRTMGIRGTATLLVKKNLSNYDDGTFSWMREGSFFKETYPLKDGAARALWGYYCGERYGCFATVCQVLWFCLLISCCFAALGPKTAEKGLLCLTLMGVSLFLLIFEARARYLFAFSPLFLLLGAMGFNDVTDFIKGLRKEQ